MWARRPRRGVCRKNWVDRAPDDIGRRRGVAGAQVERGEASSDWMHSREIVAASVKRDAQPFGPGIAAR